ncbi:hypothetical protein EJ110_NYTH50350 [Nymphaea thermarum]|nr:hypothetical protein EJ110_NYTH50350 [Nymphaea thermarum]
MRAVDLGLRRRGKLGSKGTTCYSLSHRGEDIVQRKKSKRLGGVTESLLEKIWETDPAIHILQASVLPGIVAELMRTGKTVSSELFW